MLVLTHIIEIACTLCKYVECSSYIVVSINTIQETKLPMSLSYSGLTALCAKITSDSEPRSLDRQTVYPAYGNFSSIW